MKSSSFSTRWWFANYFCSTSCIISSIKSFFILWSARSETVDSLLSINLALYNFICFLEKYNRTWMRGLPTAHSNNVLAKHPTFLESFSSVMTHSTVLVSLLDLSDEDKFLFIIKQQCHKTVCYSWIKSRSKRSLVRRQWRVWGKLRTRRASQAAPLNRRRL